ncbi:MAG: hypothetical protein LBU40_03010, partial [Methanobrevibacter sp.]|nr:hypothetical protein [Methanobrevibacter sp.]
MNDVVFLQALLIIEIIAIIISIAILIYTYKSNSKGKHVEEINVPWNYSNKTKENNSPNNNLDHSNLENPKNNLNKYDNSNINKVTNNQNKNTPHLNSEKKNPSDSPKAIPDNDNFEEKTNKIRRNELVTKENSDKHYKKGTNENEVLSITVKVPEDLIKKEAGTNKIKNDEIDKFSDNSVFNFKENPNKKMKESYSKTSEDKNKTALKKENKKNNLNKTKEKEITLDDQQFSFVSRSWKESFPEKKNDKNNLYTKFQEPMKGTQKNLISKNFGNDSISGENESGSQTKAETIEYKKVTEKIIPKTIKTGNETLTTNGNQSKD